MLKHAAKLLLGGFLCSLVAGCLWLPSEFKVSFDQSRVHGTTSAVDCPLVVLVPGLNTTPGSYEPLAGFLSSAGCPAFIAPVELHRSGESAAQLLANLRGQVIGLRKQFPKKKISLVGFSLGALVACEYLLRDDPEFVTSVALLAPAQGMHLRNFIIRPVTLLAWTGLGIRSFAPAKHRQRSFTSLRTYKALFDLYDLQYEVQSDILERRRGLVVLTENDELVGMSRSMNWLRRNKLQEWQTLILPAGEKEDLAPRHLVIHPDGIGEKAWRTLSQGLLEFVKRSA